MIPYLQMSDVEMKAIASALRAQVPNVDGVVPGVVQRGREGERDILVEVEARGHP